MKQYDIAVIGSGPGGYVAAITAAQKGKKVSLIEKKEIGGTCLNVGCIPTKCLIASANLLEKIKQSSKFGISIKELSIDFNKIQKRKDEVIENLKAGLENLLKSNKIDIIKGKARFISPHEIKIEGEENTILKAEKIIIATGSEPLEITNFPIDGKEIHNSTTILSLEKLPKSIAIIGGGYIGCEFASFFNAMGVKVSIIEALPSILANQTEDQIKAISKIFQKKEIDLFTSNKLTKIEKNKDHLLLTLENGEHIKAETCLLSVGRSLNTKDLNLENANLCIDPLGKILVNEKMETKVKNIFAIGDITGKCMLAHVASHQGIVAANNASGNEMEMRYEAIPSVIYTLPEIASVGLKENEAKERGYEVFTSTFPLSYLGKYKVLDETEGFVSLIFEKETKQILGAHMLGKDASSMIAEMALAINNELTLECIINTIHAHPTISEAWYEAALLANSSPIHHPPKRK